MTLPRLPRPIVGAIAGGFVALFLIGVGIIRALFAVASGHAVDFTPDLPELAGYVASFVVAGVLVGTLWPVRRYRLGRIGIWILGTAVVVGTIMRMESGPVSNWSHNDIWIVVTLTVVFGVAAAVGFERS